MVDEHDKLLPIAIVGRIMKQILPPSAKISKEAKERIQECASEFISFVTSEASDKCRKENRKTVNGDDICWALSSLGFDEYSEAILKYLHKYREFERERANSTKGNGTNEDKDEGSDDRPRYPASIEFRLMDLGKTSLVKPSDQDEDLGHFHIYN